MEHAILPRGTAEDNRRKTLGSLVHIQVMDLGGWERVRSPKEIVRHSLSREGDGGSQDPFSLRIGRRRQSQKRMKKGELEKIGRSWRGA